MTPIQIIQAVCIIITTLTAVGGILIFVGKSLQTLTTIKEGMEVLFTDTRSLKADMTAMKIDTAIIKTKQQDCGQCP